ncbi:MAG TPA: histidine phosphatase family protein, partial [Miltoncostaeaceae bacterium]|nr:histidine phosphatase family protein [Miltoncostaeaceae bacterium]
PPGGESRLDALGRYADGFERMLGEPARDVLAVIHDVPIRFMLNAAEGTDPLNGPVASVANAEHHRLSQAELARGLATMRERLAAAQ